MHATQGEWDKSWDLWQQLVHGSVYTVSLIQYQVPSIAHRAWTCWTWQLPTPQRHYLQCICVLFCTLSVQHLPHIGGGECQFPHRSREPVFHVSVIQGAQDTHSLSRKKLFFLQSVASLTVPKRAWVTLSCSHLHLHTGSFFSYWGWMSYKALFFGCPCLVCSWL